MAISPGAFWRQLGMTPPTEAEMAAYRQLQLDIARVTSGIPRWVLVRSADGGEVTEEIVFERRCCNCGGPTGDTARRTWCDSCRKKYHRERMAAKRAADPDYGRRKTAG